MENVIIYHTGTYFSSRSFSLKNLSNNSDTHSEIRAHSEETVNQKKQLLVWNFNPYFFPHGRFDKTTVYPILCCSPILDTTSQTPTTMKVRKNSLPTKCSPVLKTFNFH